MGAKVVQYFRRVIAVSMSVILAFSLCVASPQHAQAGMLPKSITSSLSKIALSAVKGSLAWGLGKASDAMTNDAMASVFSSARALIVGKQRILAEKTIDLIEDLSAELDALFSYTISSSTDISNMIKALTQNEYKDAFYTNAGTPVDRFTLKYNDMVDEFNTVIHAFVAYNEDPSDQNRLTLESAYNKVYGNYFKGKSYADLTDQLNALFKQPILGDANTTGFLSLISPYDPLTDIDSAEDMIDPSSESWAMRGGSSASTAYLGYYRTYINSVTNFQGNVYSSMRDAATLVDNAAFMYLQAYRYYCEFQAMLYASDASLSESDARTQTQQLWDGFYDVSRKLIRGINQMYYTQEDVFTTYMRNSDVAQTRSIQDYKNPMHFDEMLHEYEEANGYKGGIIYPEHDPSTGGKTPTTNMYTDVIKQDQHIYAFRLVSSPNKVYAIRTSTNSHSEGDGVSRGLYSPELVMVAPTSGANDQTCPSTDFFALMKGLEGGYVVPVEMSELSAIADGTITAYDTGDTLAANIKDELSMAFGSENVHLPEVTWKALSTDEDDLKYGPNFMPLRRKLYWAMLHNIFQNPDGTMSMGNASMPYSPKNEAFLDLEDDLRDYTGYEKDTHLKDTEAMVMWVCDAPSAKVTLTGAEGGDTYATIGNARLSEGGSGTYDSGTAMTIKAAPDDGYTIGSVRLLDKRGNVLEELFADVKLSDETTISTQEILMSMKENADGAYEFSVPVPCQDATVEVTYVQVDPSLLTYGVTLNDVEGDSGYDAVMQFGSYDFLGTKSFREGDQVVVSVIGYNHHMAKGITITDVAGNSIDVAYKDVTSEMQRTRPTEKLYAFTMPAKDVKVDPILHTSNTVNVNDSANVTHTFENLNLYALGGNDSWIHSKSVDFIEGDTVSISYTVESGYVVSGVEVFDSANRRVETTPADGRISFTMPASDVVVRFSEEALNTHAHMLTLAPVEGQLSLQFLNEYGDDLNLIRKQFAANDTVSVGISADAEGDTYFPDMVLTEEGSTDNVFARQEGVYDADAGRATFKMPDANATLAGALHEKPTLALDTSQDGASFQFVDADGNVLDGTQRGFVPGETVRAKLQVSDQYVFQECVLVADGSTENLFASQEGVYDAQSGMVTFTMPDANATLSVSLREKPAVTLATLHDGASLQFVDADGNVLDGSQRRFVSGDTVRAKLTASDLLVLQEFVLTTDGSTENVWATQEGLYDEQSGVATFTMPDANVTLSATFTELDPEEVDDIDTDDEGRVLVRTYEDLVKISQAMRKRPEHYASKDMVLQNNIDANGKDPWTQGIGQDEDGCRYDGTFEGNGYCIFGMRVACDSRGGLFEAIGESGVVKNLFLFDCDFQSDGSWGGGIAAMNYGRIEHCVNGLNLTNGVYIRPDTGELVSLRAYNSYVKATTAGGIVGKNYGTVYASRSAADVNASWYAGGVAGENVDGTISNCVGNGNVSSTGLESMMNQNMGYHYGSGGICAENFGAIEGGYSSAVVSAKDAKGSIAFEQGGTITDTYYTTSEEQKPYEYTGRSHSETNVNGLARGEMMADSFIQTLSGTGSNSVTWVRHNALNAGLPRIKNPSSFFADVTLSNNGVTVKGNMHRGVRMTMTPLNGVSEPWKLLVQSAAGYTTSSAYICSIQDAAGNKIPGELWAQSDLTYIVPAKSADTAIAVMYTDGSAERVSPVSVTQTDSGYMATFAASGVEAFMVLQKDLAESASSATSGTAETPSSGTTTQASASNAATGSSPTTGTTSTTTTRSTTASTSDHSQAMSLMLSLVATGLMLAGFGVYRRRRND